MTGSTDPTCIAIDVRCLQDPDYAERGVGRHTSNLLRHAPRHSGLPLIGLVDLSMPALSGTMRALLDQIVPNALAPALRRPTCFVSPSPMTHDPLFVARMLDDRLALKAAVVYDFIPYEFPERYLAHAPARHAYYTCLSWLSRYDLFMPISQASAAPLHRLLGIGDDRVIVAGAALESAFETQGPPDTKILLRHVLVIGGGDPRKNVECAIRAHAAASLLQATGVPLIITGNYNAGQIAGFRAMAEDLGGSGHLLRMPGHVSESELRDLYRQAVCVIAPSRAEGFDLPVVEAMASGAPALASDIPAHRELVQDPAWRFGPDDHARLTGLIDRLAGSPQTRAGLIAAQAPVWQHYRAVAVAERFWQPIQARLPTAPSMPSVLRHRKPRIALLSPLPPDRSGVADYTAATCAELGRLAELHVFTPTERPAKLPQAATLRPLSAWPSLSGQFDRVVNVMGNSGFHLDIFHQMLRYGGACIAHDSRMLGFYRILLGADRAVDIASRELGRPVSLQEVDSWMADEASLEVLHYGEIAAAADPMFVHSSVTAQLMRDRYAIAPTLLPFSIYRPWEAGELADPETARRRLGLPENEVVIVTFGFVHRTKAPAECLWALELLRGWGIDASLHFIGVPAEEDRLDALAAELGLAGKVTFLGQYVSDQVYRDYLRAADLGIQLRLTHLGSLSGALLDCIAAGLPTVTNASLAAVMDAPAYVRSVPDALSPLLVAEALADLLELGVARPRQEALRQDYAQAHSFAVYARRLCDALGLEVES